MLLDANGNPIQNDTAPVNKFTKQTETFIAWLKDNNMPHNILVDYDGAYVTFPWCILACMWSEMIDEGKIGLVEPPNEEGKLVAHIYTEQEAEEFLADVFAEYKKVREEAEKEEAEKPKTEDVADGE